MSFSSTVLVKPSGPAELQQQIAGEALYEAWELLRAARCVPFMASAPADWLTEFGRLAAAAAARLGEHVSGARTPRSLLHALACNTPELTGAVLAHLDDNPLLLERAARLAEAADSARQADLALVVELNEKAIELEMFIARHNNRLRALLDESGGLSMASLASPGAVS